MAAPGSSEGAGPALLLYSSLSANGHKATIALEELQLPYTLRRVDLMAGEQRRPEFLALNPAGRIPVLVDYEAGGPEGFVLPESGAILLYLAEKDPAHRLLPAGAAGRAEAISWVFYQAAHLAMPTFLLVTAGLLGMRHSQDVMQAAADQIRSAFAHLNERLAKTGSWLAGGRFSVADIAFVSSVVFDSRLLGVDLASEYPSLGGWLDRALARPAVRKGLNRPDPNPFVPEGEQAGGGGGGGGAQVLEAARGRLAKLGVHLGSA